MQNAQTHFENTDSQGKLIIVPTPIGNLGDVTVRMREALSTADTVCAEDTRVTGKLLAALDISKRIERLDEAMLTKRIPDMVKRIAAGEIIAYCSDAGMPGVSDPGLRLVHAMREAGLDVVVLPGPSAVDTAYVTSGTVDTQFYFGGFLPRKATQIEAELKSLAALKAALIFYESPNRIAASLRVIARVFPQRMCAVCRELTKIHEEVVRGTTGEVAAEFARRAETGEIKGEIALVIDSATDDERAEEKSQSLEDARQAVSDMKATGASNKDIQKALMAEYGISRNEAYELVLNA